MFNIFKDVKKLKEEVFGVKKRDDVDLISRVWGNSYEPTLKKTVDEDKELIQELRNRITSLEEHLGLERVYLPSGFKYINKKKNGGKK